MSENGIHDGLRIFASVRGGDLPLEPPVSHAKRSTSSGKTKAMTSVTIARYTPLMRVAGRPISNPATRLITADAAIAEK